MKKSFLLLVLTFITIISIGQINNFPWHDDFSTHNTGSGTTTNGWSCDPSVSTSYSWRVWSIGVNTSGSTGPVDDNGGDHKYIYTEASGYSTGDIAYLLSPVFDITSLNNPELSFFYHMFGSDMGDLAIQVIKNGGIINETIISGEQHFTENAAWNKIVVDLAGFTGNIQIKFKGIRGNNYRSDICIDDFDIHEEILCPGTINETTTVIKDVAAQLNWTEFGSANNWSIEYGSDGFALGTGITVNNILIDHYTVSGLVAETDYQWYVRSNCGANGNSVWAGPFSFTTSPVPVYPPYSQNFDDMVIVGYQTLPDGMEAYGDVYSRHTILNDPAASGENHLMIIGSGTQMLYSPPVYVEDGTSYDISFNYVTENGENDEWDITLNSGTTKSHLNMDDVGASAEDQVNTDYVHFKRTYVATADMVMFFGVKMYCSSYGKMFIDDFRIEETTICPQPAILLSDNVLLNSADLSWTETGVASIWDIEWKMESDFVPGTLASSGSDVVNPNPSKQISNLNANTEYFYYTRSKCGVNDSSNWTGPNSFTTKEGKAVNPSPADSAVPVALISRTLNWDDVQASDSYIINIGTSPGGTDVANAVACANSQYVKPFDWDYSTRYYWTITTIYNGGSTVVGDEWNFYTECDVISDFPFTNSFENGVPSDCWFETDVVGISGDWSEQLFSPYQTGNELVTPYSGSKMATFNSFIALNNNTTRLETPSLDFNALASPEVSFYMYHDGGYSSKIDRIQVQVFTGGAWVNVGSHILRYASYYSIYYKNWGKHTIDLSAYAGSIVKVGILGICGDGTDIHIDEFMVQDAPSCANPGSQDESSVFLNSVELSWLNVVGVSQYDIEYGHHGFIQGNGTMLSGINGSSYQLDGILGSTSYDWYVRSDCGGGDASTWTGPHTFKTSYFSSNPISGLINKCSPTYQRLDDDGALAADGQYSYDSYSFTVPKSGEYNITGVFTGYTGYIHLYSNSFDPENPSNNWLIGAEESSNNQAYTDYIQLTTGVTYIIVGTTVESNITANIGSCRYYIKGDGLVNVSPNTDINGIAIGVSNTVPSTDGSARTANYECEDDQNWTHYYDDNGTATNYSDDNVLLSVKKNGNEIGSTSDDGFSVSLAGSAGVSLIQKAQAPYVFDDGGWYVYNRYWNLTPTLQPNSAVNIRYYYTNADFSALKNAISNMGGSVPTNHQATAYFKINALIGNYNPSPENGHMGVPLATAYNTDGCWIYINDNEASTISWDYGNYDGAHYSELQVGNFSGGGGGASTVDDLSGSPLPITLGEFTAYENNEVNTIFWTTLSETNTDEFIIEKSSGNSFDFREMARITAANNSNISLDYSLEDEDPDVVSYYRITTIDMDGSKSQSQIIIVERKNEDNTLIISKILPNPTKDQSKIVFSSPMDAKTQLQVSDMLGNIIIVKSMNAQSGLNFTDVDLINCKSGVYILTLRNNYSTTVSKIIKQ